MPEPGHGYKPLGGEDFPDEWPLGPWESFRQTVMGWPLYAVAATAGLIAMAVAADIGGEVVTRLAAVTRDVTETGSIRAVESPGGFRAK